MVEMFVKVEFELSKEQAKRFDDWLSTRPDGFKATVMSKDQIQ